MRTWIPWKEIFEENMKTPGYAERFEAACKRLDEQIEKYGTIANPKPIPTPHTARARALFSRLYRKNRVRAKEKPAFALQRKRVVA